MKLPFHKFASRILPVLSDRHFAETPLETGPRKRVANLSPISASSMLRKRKIYRLTTKNTGRRRSGIFCVSFSRPLVQNFLGRSHVEIISYSQFKSLVKKDLINDLVIRETTIDGNLKAAAVKEIFTPGEIKGYISGGNRGQNPFSLPNGKSGGSGPDSRTRSGENTV